jgi:hypothetical protein
MSRNNIATHTSEIGRRVIAVTSGKNKISVDRILAETGFAEFGAEILYDDPLKVKNSCQTAQLFSQALAEPR